MPRSATSRRPTGSTACWTGGWPGRTIWPAATRSPTWRPGRGCRASSGRRSISTSTPTWRAGIRRLRHGQQCRRGITFRSSSRASRCRREANGYDRRRKARRPMATKAGFSGVIAPVLTPFDEDGTPDADRFTEHARWLMAEGCTALAPFGTTSEANSLGLDERMELLEELVDDGIEPANLMPGTGTCSLADTVALTEHAVDLGCGGVLMLPPIYYTGISE